MRYVQFIWLGLFNHAGETHPRYTGMGVLLHVAHDSSSSSTLAFLSRKVKGRDARPVRSPEDPMRTLLVQVR